MGTVDIENIMDEIRSDIVSKGYKSDDVIFSEIPVAVSYNGLIHSMDLEGSVRLLSARSNVQPYRELKSSGILGSVKVFSKKVIRKIMKFYVEPVVYDQNAFNETAAECFKDMLIEHEMMKLKLKKLEADNEDLCKRLAALEPEESTGI